MNYQQSDKTKAVFFMLLSSLFFALMAAFVKWAGDIPSMEKALFRNLVSLVIAFVLLRVKKQPLWGEKKNRKILVLRGITGTAGILLYFYGIDHLILADSSMLNRLSPFFVILFAWVLLKNPIRPMQLLSLALALGGSALIIKPGFQFGSPLPALVCFLSAVFAGFSYTLVSFLGGKENSYTIVFYFSLISSLICLPLTVLHPVIPSGPQLAALIAAGIMAAGGQFLLTAAYRYAPAGEVSIYQYSNIIFASILGIFIFAERPDPFSITGYLLIITAGYIVYRKGRMKAEAVPAKG